MQPEKQPSAEDLRTTLGPILEQNSSKWLRFTMGILGSEADAEDALQEAIQRVLARNQQLPSREHVRMYLGRAVGNAALEFFNQRKRERVRHISIDDCLCLADPGLSPYDRLEEKETALQKDRLLQLVHQGLTCLPWKQYEALRLTILESEGSSMRSVGAACGIPYSTLRHRSKQGLRRLRRYVEHALKMEKQLQPNKCCTPMKIT